MPHVKIMINSVWGTKNRYPFLKGDVKSKIISHIRENAIQKGIFIDTINGHHDHLHCLFELKPTMCVSDALQLLKGESSRWMNLNKIIPLKFEWAVDFYAVSASKSDLPRIRSYINNQEAHHSKITFQDEYDGFIREYF